MYVKRVILESIRGFEKLDLRFDRPDSSYHGWWVVTGDNGSGKTALLKAIALALIGPDPMRTLQPSFSGWIQRSQKEATVAVEIVAGERDKFQAGRRYERPFWSELSLSRNGGPEVSLNPGRKYRGKEKGPAHGPWTENPNGWFCAGYGPFRRLYGASPEAQRVMSSPGRVARFATMFREDATLGECEMWLKDLHHRSLENHEKERIILEYVKKLLDDDFLENGLKIDRVDSSGLWLKQGNGIVLPLADMSEGYRAALAMLVDIVRNLVNVHGPEGLLEQREDGRLIVPHQGVVLIDEVDAHLHPEWQRKIGFWLKGRLPGLQFIVTTHSAMICQAADGDGLFYLPPPGSGEPAVQIKGLDYLHIVKGKPDEILTGPAFRLLNTRSEPAVEERRELARLRSKKRSIGLSHDESKRYHELCFMNSNGSEGDPE